MILLNSEYKDQSLIDAEAGLLNREGFELQGSRRLRDNMDLDFAVIRLDIYRYKMVREFVGYLESAKLIRYIGDLINSQSNKNWTCGHFGSDSFAILLPFDTLNEVYQIVEDIVEEIMSYNIPCKILPAAGICIVENHLEHLEYLTDCAKIALDTVKGSFINHYAVFDTEIRKEILYNRKIETRTLEAIQNQEFQVYFQPQVNVDTGRVVGVEALARWNKNQEGIIYPIEFISVFENNGFIIDLDYVIWEKAFEQKMKWKQQGIHIPNLTVNVSSAHKLDHIFVLKFNALIQKYHLNPNEISIEINDKKYVYDTKQRYETLKILKNKGYKIAFDDFGGNSISVSILTEFDIDIISLDRNFIAGIGNNEKNNTIIKGAIDIFHQLGISIITEGIESKEQVDFLLSCDCHTGVGYYFYKPMTAEQLEDKIIKHEIQIK